MEYGGTQLREDPNHFPKLFYGAKLTQATCKRSYWLAFSSLFGMETEKDPVGHLGTEAFLSCSL